MNYLLENQYIPNNLENYIKDTPLLHKYFESSFGNIKPKNYCGFLNIENSNYFIIPKITEKDDKNLDIFIYMLIYAYDIKLDNIDLLSAKNCKSSIFEIFIKLFVDKLLKELKIGIFKQYITFEDNLKVLRGKYIIEKNFTNFYHQNIYSQYDEFSADNELNRFFLYAIKIFKRYSSYSNLYKCEVIFDEVNDININIKDFKMKFDRLNARFKKSFETALMILNQLVPLTDNSEDKSFAFLFDMSKVFEKFVGKMFQDIDDTTLLQYSEDFGSLRLQPDIKLKDMIIDIKYKKIDDRSDLKVQDKYQMFVYGVNFKIKDTMLLYPKHLYDIYDKLILGKDNDIDDDIADNEVILKLRSLDLSFDGGYFEFIDEMKKRVRIINTRGEEYE